VNALITTPTTNLVDIAWVDHRLWGTDSLRRLLYCIEPISGNVEGEIKVAFDFGAIASHGRSLYVVERDLGLVSELVLTEHEEGKVAPHFQHALPLADSFDGFLAVDERRVCFYANGSQCFYFLDRAKNRVTHELEFNFHVVGCDWLGEFLCVAEARPNRLHLMAVPSGEILASTVAPDSLRALAAASSGLWYIDGRLDLLGFFTLPELFFPGRQQ
jgi:hypothetical protein